MKAFVIAIEGHAKSQAAANKCIKSGTRNGLVIEKWKATTPADNIVIYAQERFWPLGNWVEKYSRSNNCLAAFISHYRLWNECILRNETIAIFEHDAIITSPIHEPTGYGPICTNIGAPSYGKYDTPNILGINPLTSKRYFPGAHGYIVNPTAAQILVDGVRGYGRPTDLYLNLDVFPWLTEVYPWPVEARDTFTTIQTFAGCQAKHKFNDSYQISDIINETR